MNRLKKGQSAGAYKHIQGFKQEDVKANLTEEMQSEDAQEAPKAQSGGYFPSFLPGAAGAEDKAAKAMAAARAVAASMAASIGAGGASQPTSTATATPTEATAPAQPARKRRAFSDAAPTMAAAAATGTPAPEQPARKRRTFSEGPPSATTGRRLRSATPSTAAATTRMRTEVYKRHRRHK